MKKVTVSVSLFAVLVLTSISSAFTTGGVAADGNSYIICGGGAMGTAATVYYHSSIGANTNENLIPKAVVEGGTLVKICGQQSSTNTQSYTVRKNGVNTALSHSLSLGNQKNCATNSVSLSATDELTVASGGTNAAGEIYGFCLYITKP